MEPSAARGVQCRAPPSRAPRLHHRLDRAADAAPRQSAHDLFVLDDAAQSFGASWQNRRVGTFTVSPD